jgi:Domain of unknown function (DUF4926)
MIEELEVVVLTRAVPECGLEVGDVGTIVLFHEVTNGYTVEFTDFRGNTVAIADVPADAVRPVRDREIAHARQVA